MKSHYLRFTFFAMGGQNEIQLYTTDADRAKRIASKVHEEIKRIETKYSRYRETSIISKINRAAGECAVALDQETAALLRYSDACFKQSNGLFDITSGVLRKVWNFKQNTLPSSYAIQAQLSRIGWNKVQWNDQQILLPEPGMEIDFGGIGKEYAVDRAIGLLTELGIESALVNLGGDLRASAPRPDGSPWRVGIRHPRQDAALSGVVELYRGAIASSGDYERFITVGGRRFCHILNPRTGWSVSGIQSVTVVADSCLIAGSSSTTTMLLGLKAGSKYLRDQSLSHYLIGDHGRNQIVENGIQGQSRFCWLKSKHETLSHCPIPKNPSLECGTYLGNL